MELNFEDIITEYSYIGEKDYFFPIEKYTCDISIRNALFIDEIDEIICGVINLHQGQIDFNSLGDVLGFSVYDKIQERKYQDKAEVDLLKFILKEREDFNLIKVGKNVLNPTVELTEQGADSLTTRIKHKYFNGRFIGYSVRKILGVNIAETLKAFDIKPQVETIHRVSIDELRDFCFFSKELHSIIQQHCIGIPEFENAQLLSFTEPTSYAKCSQPVLYKLYVHPITNDEILLAYHNGKLLTQISDTLNNTQNQLVKNSIVRDVRFSIIWSDPATIYDSKLLLCYLDMWDWDALLEKNVNWHDAAIWNIFVENCNKRIWRKLSAVCPTDIIIQQLDNWQEKWDWADLSERLPDKFILENIIKHHKHWDFEVLSQKDMSFVRPAMLAIQEYNRNEGVEEIKPQWNFYDVTESLDEDFIIHAISAGATLNYQNISLKPYSFVSKIISQKSEAFSNWNYQSFSEKWEIDELIQETGIQQNINWYTVLTRICSDKPLIDYYLRGNKLDEIIERNCSQIRSFTTEKLEWDDWLINYLDGKSLILWQTTITQKGFDVNPYVLWNEELLKKYISKFNTSEGRTFLSKKVESVEFIRNNIGFNYDWITILENLSNNEKLRKQLTTDVLFEFRDQLPWKEICRKINNESFFVKNALKFIDYFDFEVLSSRSPQILEQLLQIHELTNKPWNWSLVSQHVEDDFILRYFCDYPWDFSVLSNKSSVFIEQAISKAENYSLLWKWDLLAHTLSYDCIVSILPKLDIKYSSVQPPQMKQFWKDITRRLDRDFLTTNAGKYSFEWDWTFITRELFSKDEILQTIDDRSGYWDWAYLLENKISSEELVYKPLFKHIQMAKALISDDLAKRKVITLLTTKLINKPALLEYWMSAETQQPSIVNLDWDLLSDHNQFYYNDSFLEKYAGFWNWDLISSQKNIFRVFDENGVFQVYLRDGIKRRLKNKLLKWNWSILSRNDSLIKNFSILSDKNFINKWDWQYISEFGKFIDPSKHFAEVNKRYIQLQDFIDWRLLSRRKDLKFSRDFLAAFQNKNWDWALLSESYNLDIDNDFLIQMQGCPWNWKALSKNKHIKLALPKTSDEISDSASILITLKDKDWDWAYLSERKDLEIDYHLLRETKDKPWNFTLLTRHFISDTLLLENCLDLLFEKKLDWGMLSSLSLPLFNANFIDKYKDYWDWAALSKNNSLQLNEELIQSFDYWHYVDLTQRKEVIENPHWIFMLKNKDWDWDYISSSSTYNIDEEFIDRLSDRLNFPLLSANQSVKFTPAILKKYFKKWDYNLLENNYAITRYEILETCLKNILSENAAIKFVQKINSTSSIYSTWKGYIYHFTHLTNAATIIGSKKILSRDSANKTGFSNAAGLVVENRHDAHKFARFYFRPQTPTQFYNENLGIDSSSGILKQWKFYNGDRWVSNSKWASHYPQAQKLGFPRCPVPVFFRFKLSEVLDKIENDCYVSNGNMQTGWAQYGTINQMIDKFNFDDLYSSIGDTKKDDWKDYITYSQQEFLIKNEFDFSGFSNIDIFVPDESSKKALLNLIEWDNDLAERIFVDDYKSSLYHRRNRTVSVSYENEKLEITTDYKDRHTLLIEFDQEHSKFVTELDGLITSISNHIIKGESRLKAVISNGIPFKVKFRDELNREWIVYKTGPGEHDHTIYNTEKSANTELSGLEIAVHHVREFIAKAPELQEYFRMKVRHYILFNHTVLVYKQYLKYPWPIKSKRYNELLRTFIILHDVGKPSANAIGNKENQYQFTQNIIIQMWDKTSFTSDDLDIVLSLSNGDIIGEYFQGKRNIYETTSELGRLAKKARIGLDVFFELFMVYYQCDVASYTQDANGFAFLEYLFEYKDGSKIFDTNEGCLRFSSKYLAKYLKLKKHVLAWQ